MDESKILEGIYRIQKDINAIKDNLANVKDDLADVKERLGSLETRFDRFQMETNETLEEIKTNQERMQMTIDIFAERVLHHANDIRTLKSKVL